LKSNPKGQLKGREPAYSEARIAKQFLSSAETGCLEQRRFGTRGFLVDPFRFGRARKRGQEGKAESLYGWKAGTGWAEWRRLEGPEWMKDFKALCRTETMLALRVGWKRSPSTYPENLAY